MTKQTPPTVTKTQDNFLAPLQTKSAWGNAPQLSPKDITIPRILLMQGQSEKVLSGDAGFGDLRDSVSGDLLGGPKKPLEVIPFLMKKVIIVSEKEARGTKYNYKETLEATPENENLPWEEGNLKRQKIMSFFVLLPEELAKGGAIPKLISFRGTSMEAGKIIATQMHAINGSATPWLPPPAFVMSISVKLDKNDKGNFAVLEAKKGRASTPDEIATAFHWFESIQGGHGVKVDDVSEEAPLPSKFAPTPEENLQEPTGF